MSPILLALSLAAPAQAAQGIALRGGVWEVLCTGGEMMEITWFDDPARAWAYVQSECGGVANISGMDLEVGAGRPDEGGNGNALYLARNGMDFWPGASGELLMADMDGAASNRTPERTGTGQALDTFIMGPTTPQKIGPGRVLLVLDAALYDEVLVQFGPCAPATGATCDGRLDMRTFYEMAGIKLSVQPDARWVRAQEPPRHAQWTAHPHQAWLSPQPGHAASDRLLGSAHTDTVALEAALAASARESWDGMVNAE